MSCAPVKAQNLGVVAVAPDDEPAGTPVAKPEPRQRVSGNPVHIFQKLIASSEAERKIAAQSLHWHTSEFPIPFDARLLLVNLDADDEQEVIFILSGSPMSTVALVFDHQPNGWWRVGRFDYWWHWDGNQAERLIELREIVRYGRKDILVRTTEGVTVSDKRTIDYPEEDSPGCYLVVHHVVNTEPDEPAKAKPVKDKKSCSVYRWDSGRFTFTLDTASAGRFCLAGGGK